MKNPKTFNEKVNWLKLHDRKPLYTTMVDKYEAKKYVAERIGEEHIIPTYGVWERFEDIDFDALPNQFVLKASSLGLYILESFLHLFSYDPYVLFFAIPFVYFVFSTIRILDIRKYMSFGISTFKYIINSGLILAAACIETFSGTHVYLSVLCVLVFAVMNKTIDSIQIRALTFKLIS